MAGPDEGESMLSHNSVGRSQHLTGPNSHCDIWESKSQSQHVRQVLNITVTLPHVNFSHMRFSNNLCVTLTFLLTFTAMNTVLQHEREKVGQLDTEKNKHVLISLGYSASINVLFP